MSAGERVTTLAAEYPKEQARCRELLKNYSELGLAGVLETALIKATLQRADKAMADANLVEMVRAMKDMQGCK